MFLDMDEEEERLRDNVKKNLVKEQCTRHIYAQDDQKTAAQLDEMRERFRVEERLLWQKGGSTRTYSERLRKDNIEAENRALQHRMEKRKQADARLQALSARLRAEEAADQAAVEDL